MPNRTDRLEMLRARLADFAAERDWDQFHNPKNLAMAVAGEVGELVEHFQWLTFEEAENLSAAARQDVALEAARGRHYAVPVSHFEILESGHGFTHRRHVRKLRIAPRRRHCERAHPAGLDVLDDRRHRVEVHYDLSAEEIDDRRAAAFIGHVHDI